MEKMTQQNIKDIITRVVELAESSNKDKKYWMVRTDNGLNYQSFYSKGYVALSLENYPLEIISEAKKFLDKPVLAKTCIKDCLKKYHMEGVIKLNKEPDEKSYASTIGRIAGQIYSFVFELAKNDIVIIPSEGSTTISIGQVIDDELFIDDSFKVNDFTFKKKIRWITTIPKRKLDPCLYRALGAHQAVSNISEYAEFIERNYNSIFNIGNEYHYVLTINSSKVKARQLTRMVNDMLNLVEDFSSHYQLNLDVNSIDLSVNLNSPGKIDLKSTISVSVLLMAIATSFSGGSMKFENLEFTTNGIFQSLIQAINDYRTTSLELERKYEFSDSYFNSLEVKSVEEWNRVMEREATELVNDSI